MELDLAVAVAGALVGLCVGLTGMGGGALMTPIMVLVFGVPPLAAVGSDLVASLVMKPIGGAVHGRAGRVDWPLVRWLAAGSVPAAFLGVLAARALGTGDAVQAGLKVAIGAALMLAVVGLVARAVLAVRRGAGGGDTAEVTVRPVRTVLIGVIGGVAVGLTSVGSGSLIIVMLMLAYPALRPGRLVGTDIVQAVPLVAAAAAGHAIFGDVRLGLTASLLVGAVPGTYVGARLALRARPGALRIAIATLLLASALKLWTLPNSVVLAAVLVSLLIAAAWSRWRHVVAMRDLAVVGAPPPLHLGPAQAPAQAPT